MLTLDTESYGNGAIEEYRSLGPISEQIYLCPRFLRCMRSLSHIFQAKNSSLTSKIHTC